MSTLWRGPPDGSSQLTLTAERWGRGRPSNSYSAKSGQELTHAYTSLISSAVHALGLAHDQVRVGHHSVAPPPTPAAAAATPALPGSAPLKSKGSPRPGSRRCAQRPP